MKNSRTKKPKRKTFAHRSKQPELSKKARKEKEKKKKWNQERKNKKDKDKNATPATKDNAINTVDGQKKKKRLTADASNVTYYNCNRKVIIQTNALNF